MFSPTGGSQIHVAIPQVYRWRYPLDCGGSRNFALMVPAFKKPKWEWLKTPFHARKYDIAFMGAITDGGSRDVGGINEHRSPNPPFNLSTQPSCSAWTMY